MPADRISVNDEGACRGVLRGLFRAYSNARGVVYHSSLVDLGSLGYALRT
jgi:hypothetical protein